MNRGTVVSATRLDKRNSSSQEMEHGLEKVLRLLKALGVHGVSQSPSQAWLIFRGAKIIASLRYRDGNNSQRERNRGTVLHLRYAIQEPKSMDKRLQ